MEDAHGLEHLSGLGVLGDPIVEAEGTGQLERLTFIMRVYCLLASMVCATALMVMLAIGDSAIRRLLADLLRDWWLRQRPLQRVSEPDIAGCPPQDAACRICQEGRRTCGGQADPIVSSATDELACFCACKGSLAFVHRSCLDRWRALQRRDQCELCGAAYLTEGAGPQKFLSMALQAAGQSTSSLHTMALPVTSLLLVDAIIVALVCLWLRCTAACEQEAPSRALVSLTSCTLENTASGWLRSICGACAIGCFAPLLCGRLQGICAVAANIAAVRP
mmetsp:Transcript_2388/g.6805  ORF Transcript_2388/g.6805 Transcript_2388/m.6805 type:complete len:277 (+) Transcript_2388:84-914(+)|eukprot:CAMPEP_0179020692 /NCGR_PEP_ID=MMETSP0796-20121207/5507_1 /TAXON_ID=73915 /ORGANISM="Pyrodinium bahamense, Strain pbaha01" /LENGTH=276 /DNA_ID=CAMNT_0020716503 /DNA_START=1 /DNA_END=831 /DNA_ORIENTATION=+